jgi:Tat protein translocase TatB subunit
VFNLQGSEIIFILLLALVVLGPEKLPGAIKRAMHTYAELRKLGSGFQDEFKSVIDEPMREIRETADLIKEKVDPNTIAADADRAADAAAAADRADAAMVAAQRVDDGESTDAGVESDVDDGSEDTDDDFDDPFDDPVDDLDEPDDSVDEPDDSVDDLDEPVEMLDATDPPDGSAANEAMEESA